ncbi:MAG: hypothetical protein ACK5RL_00355 [Acidimicrobiales bacterium]
MNPIRSDADRPSGHAGARAGRAVPGPPDLLTVGLRTAGWLTASTLAVAIVVSATGLVGSVVSWVLVAGAVAAGLTPSVWTLGVRRYPAEIHLHDITPATRAAVRAASVQADRLWRAAHLVPPGPVADHLTDLATTADRYLESLAALGPESSGASGQIVTDLTDLADAAERLAHSRAPSVPTPLQDLAERTDLMTRALAEDIDPRSPLP